MKRLLSALLLFLACTAHSQTYSDIALQNSSGNYARVVPFAPVTVCQASDTAVPCTNKATTYTDQTLGTACALSSPSTNSAPTSGPGCNNPGVADINGNYTVFLAPGTYRVCVYAGNYLCELKGTAGGSASGGTVQGTANQITASTVGTTTTLALANPTTFPGGATFNGAVSINSGIGAVGLIPDPLCAFSFGLGSQDQLCNLNGQLVWNYGGVTGTNFLIPWMKYYDLIGSPPSNGSVIFFNSVTGQFELLSGNTGSTKVLQEDAAGNLSFATAAGAVLQTNGVNNTSQTTLNFQTSTANAVGLTVTPSNPSAGNEKLEITGSSYTGNAATATNVAYSGITAGSNTVAKTEGTSGSLAPLNVGQIAGSQVWLSNINFIAPTVNTSAPGAGGSFTQGHTALVKITFNTALGETAAGLKAAGTVCGVGGGCTATVTAPTLPTGYTGYTVYSCDTSDGSTCSGLGPLGRQNASAACVNITINCVISTSGAGLLPVPPTSNTSVIQPPNVQANECLANVIPIGFVQTNDGNYHSQWGVSPESNNGNTGTLTFCRKFFVNDFGNVGSTFTTQALTSFNNSLVALNHGFGVNTVTTNQDRALSVYGVTPVGDASTRYAVEAIQSQLDFNCNGCAINGSPDGEVTVFSGQMNNLAATNYTSSFGTDVARLHYFKQAAGNDTGGQNIIKAIFQFNNLSGSGLGVGLNWSLAGSGTVTGMASAAVWAQFLSTITMANGQVGMTVSGTPGGGNNGFNYVITNSSVGIPSNLNGNVSISGYSSNVTSLFTANASEQLNGSLTIAQPSAPSPNSLSCTGGAAQYGYTLVGIDSNGGASPGTQNLTPSTCVNPLTVGNPATLSITTTLGNQYSLTNPTYLPFKQIDVYRTAGPMATGKIGTLTCSGGATGVSACSNFVDNGLSATGTVPSVNTTGGLGATGIIAGGNTVYVANDFTSAANTNLQTITGLVWNVSQAAQKHAFHCSLNYSQATAAAAMQFGIQVATVAPNSVDARGRVDTSATAVASGTLNALNTTTATAIVTFTPSNFATVFGAELDGTIDLPQNNQGNVINIMVQTSNAADLPTVKKGSYCSILP